MRIGFGMLCHNNLQQSQRTVGSIRKQDIDHAIFILDNASTDDTHDWLRRQDFAYQFESENRGISEGWNILLDNLFAAGCDYVLVTNNDVVLPPWFSTELVSYDAPLVTGFEVCSLAEIENKLPRVSLVPYPDFSAYMIRRDCWDMVGRFDNRMFNYCSDCDYHVRAHRLGISMWKANVPYYHERSSTINLATPERQQWMHNRADEDRKIFKAIYGCQPGSDDYLRLLDLK